MPEKKCPKCGLWNSEYAMICDCGFEFPEPPKVETLPEKSEGDAEEEKLPDIKCPECGLWNVATASICDCGFDLTHMPQAESGEEQAEEPPPPDTTPPFGKLPPISTFSDQACLRWVRNLFRLAFRPNERTITEISEDSEDAEWSAAFMYLFLILLYPIIQFLYSILKPGGTFSGCVSCLASDLLTSAFASWLPVLGFSIVFAMALRRNQPETKIFLHNSLYFGTLTASLLSIILGIFSLISTPLLNSDWIATSSLKPAIGIAVLLLFLAGAVYLMFIVFRIIRTLASPEEQKRARRIAFCVIAIVLANLLDRALVLVFYLSRISLPSIFYAVINFLQQPSLYYLLWIAAIAWMIRKTSIPVKGWLLVSIAGLLISHYPTQWTRQLFYLIAHPHGEIFEASFLDGIPSALELILFAGIQWLYLRQFTKTTRYGSMLWPLGFILAYALPLKPFLSYPTELSLLAQFGLPGVLLVYWFPPNDPASWSRPGRDWLDFSFEKLRAAVDRTWNRPLGG